LAHISLYFVVTLQSVFTGGVKNVSLYKTVIVALYRDTTIYNERSFYGSEILTLRKTEQKYVESFEMWCWRRMEKTNWNYHVRHELLLTGKEERNIIRGLAL